MLTLIAAISLAAAQPSATTSALKVVAMDDQWAPVDAMVRFLAGPAPQSAAQLGEDGEARFELSPGLWQGLVVDGVHDPYEATVTLGEGAVASIVARFPATPAPQPAAVEASIDWSSMSIHNAPHAHVALESIEISVRH